MPTAHVAGAGITRFGRREEGLAALAAEAAAPALEAAGVAPDALDHAYVASQAPEEFTGHANVATHLATELGLVPTPATRVEAAPASGAAAVEAATRAIESGAAEAVLVVGVEKMTGLPTDRASRVLAKMMDPRERVYGLTMPALAAMTTRRYLHAHGLTREDLALAPVKAHAHGVLNPHAHFQREVTVEGVLAAPAISDPLTLYDCAPMSDGAAALVLTRAEAPVRVRGQGRATDQYALGDRRDARALTSFRATRLAAERAYRATGLRPGDVDVVETHDAFSVLELMNPEDLGLLKPGEAMARLRAGDTSRDGALPINPSGGLKARGHPVGATGVAQVAELYWQLTGAAGARQVPSAPRVGLAHNIGGYGNNVVVTLLEATE